MKKLEDIKAILDRPLPDEAVTVHETKPYLSNIKAIYVTERLNEAFGLGNWEVSSEFVEKSIEVKKKKNGEEYHSRMIVVKSTFIGKAEGGEVHVPDIFGGNDNEDLGDAYKGACTDALTKIGSYLGIGADVFKGKQKGNGVKAKVHTDEPFSDDQAAKDIPPQCPSCSGTMKQRTSAKGKFWGCMSYPNCKGTLPY